MARAKGSILIHFRDFVRTYHGESTLESCLKKLNPEDRAVLEGLVIHSGWYPVGVWNRALGIFLKDNYPDPDAGMRKLSQYIANEDLNSVYKMILRLGSAEFLLKRTTSLWNRYFEKGSFHAEEVEPHRWRLLLSAPKGEDAAPDYFTCGPGVCAWLVHGLALTGVTATVEHVKCRLSAGPHCEYSARW